MRKRRRCHGEKGAEGMRKERGEETLVRAAVHPNEGRRSRKAMEER